MHWEKSQGVSYCNRYASSRRFLWLIDRISCCLTSHCKLIFKASSTISLKDHCLSLSAAITGLKPTQIFQLFHHTVRYEVYLHELSRGCRQFSFSLFPPVPVSILTVCLPLLPSPSSETWHWHLKCQSDVHSYRNPFSACHLPLNRDSHFPAAYPHFLYPLSPTPLPYLSVR